MDLSIEGKTNEKRIGEREKKSLKRYLLEKVQAWINALLEAERDEFLGRGRYESSKDGNYRNGYRRRKLNLLGFGDLELRVPRDRKGELESAWLPDRKRQDPELEAFLAEAFLAGLSTRDLARIPGSKKATISNLTPATTYAFQIRALGQLGYTNWSDSMTFVVA